MVATFSKSQDWSMKLWRQGFDAWENVRLGAQTGDPTGRYCANLGHKQDDESGLIYMRARYYEPTSGRFVSQDVAKEGLNWFVYCNNNPVIFVDSTGTSIESLIFAIGFAAGLMVGSIVGYVAAALMFESLNPGYQANYLQNMACIIGFGAAGTAGSLVFEPWAKTASIKETAFMIRLHLMQSTAWAKFGGPVGVGLTIGLLVGVFTAVIEFHMSDYFKES